MCFCFTPRIKSLRILSQHHHYLSRVKGFFTNYLLTCHEFWRNFGFNYCNTMYRYSPSSTSDTEIVGSVTLSLQNFFRLPFPFLSSSPRSWWGCYDVAHKNISGYSSPSTAVQFPREAVASCSAYASSAGALLGCDGCWGGGGDVIHNEAVWFWGFTGHGKRTQRKFNWVIVYVRDIPETRYLFLCTLHFGIFQQMRWRGNGRRINEPRWVEVFVKQMISRIERVSVMEETLSTRFIQCGYYIAFKGMEVEEKWG